MVCYYCCLLLSCCQALNSKTVHHHEEQEWKMMRMSVEYSPQSWEDSQSDAMKNLSSFRRREVDLTCNNDDEMVIMMKM